MNYIITATLASWSTHSVSALAWQPFTSVRMRDLLSFSPDKNTPETFNPHGFRCSLWRVRTGPTQSPPQPELNSSSGFQSMTHGHSHYSWMQAVCQKLCLGLRTHDFTSSSQPPCEVSPLQRRKRSPREVKGPGLFKVT